MNLSSSNFNGISLFRGYDNYAFTSRTIQPDEELSRRGYTMYDPYRNTTNAPNVWVRHFHAQTNSLCVFQSDHFFLHGNFIYFISKKTKKKWLSWHRKICTNIFTWHANSLCEQKHGKNCLTWESFMSLFFSNSVRSLIACLKLRFFFHCSHQNANNGKTVNAAQEFVQRTTVTETIINADEEGRDAASAYSIANTETIVMAGNDVEMKIQKSYPPEFRGIPPPPAFVNRFEVETEPNTSAKSDERQ